MHTPNEDMHYETARKYIPVDFNHFVFLNVKLYTFTCNYKHMLGVWAGPVNHTIDSYIFTYVQKTITSIVAWRSENGDIFENWTYF